MHNDLISAGGLAQLEEGRRGGEECYGLAHPLLEIVSKEVQRLVLRSLAYLCLRASSWNIIPSLFLSLSESVMWKGSCSALHQRANT